MTRATETGNPHLRRFEALEGRWGSNGSSWALPLRRRGIATFSELGIPTPKHEEWKYTDVRELEKLPLALAETVTEPDPAQIAVLIAALEAEGDESVSRLVLVDGRFSERYSDLTGLPSGVRVLPFGQAVAEHRAQIEASLGTVADDQAHPFVALNTAFFQDGAYVFVPRGTRDMGALHVLHVTTGSGGATAAHPRNLIVLEESTQFRVIEDYASIGTGVFLTNPVTEAIVGPNARLELYKIGRESADVFHLAGTFVRMDRDAHVHTHNLSQGGRLTRNDVWLELAGTGGECILNGLNVARNRQLMDDHTSIVHAVPHCSSREYYRSVLSDESQGVFNGKVFVRPDAQKTDGIQSNNALILSPKALMNTKPQLEIFADDVRCTHGATIGQLDSESLFYLRSRGIDAGSARWMLVQAFASDVIERMEWKPVRDLATAMLERSLGR